MQWETTYKGVTTQRKNCVKTVKAGRSIYYLSFLIPELKRKQKERCSNSEHFPKKTERNTYGPALWDLWLKI